MPLLGNEVPGQTASLRLDMRSDRQLILDEDAIACFVAYLELVFSLLPYVAILQQVALQKSTKKYLFAAKMSCQKLHEEIVYSLSNLPYGNKSM
ncbi:hypothetical protein CDAR_220151 [Caerostris darwini]|uniref:Uncharacterized protein n=1 Tax=Caerostris darwini TaxID=1538125 RepID=A0AAV4VHC4_9ARAC|nr:hypothetical protein CDAR_220151 [Caerostris darwini]